MDIEFPRGDTKILKFKIKDNNGEELQLADTDKLYFTVKKNPRSKDIVMQKTLNKGIEKREDGYYYIKIDSIDTANLSYGTYGYDIEIKTISGIVKTLLLGEITLTEEYTHRRDEI